MWSRCVNLLTRPPDDVGPPSGAMDSVQGLENFPDQSRSLASMGPEFMYRLLGGTFFIRRDMAQLNAVDDIMSTFPPPSLLDEQKLPSFIPQIDMQFKIMNSFGQHCHLSRSLTLDGDRYTCCLKHQNKHLKM